jgi:hypothetical protein
MKSSGNDALRLKVIQDVMDLDDDNLRKLHEVMTLVSNKHNPVLYDLLHSSVEELEENLPVYTTKEVMDEMDSEMGWK